jgi:hypothetical protein
MLPRLLSASGFALALAGCASWHAPVTEVMPPQASGSDAAFAQIDLDGNGILQRGELEAQRAVALLQDLPAADANGNGDVSREEWDRWWPRMTRTAPAATMRRLNPVAIDRIPTAPPPPR